MAGICDNQPHDQNPRLLTDFSSCSKSSREKPSNARRESSWSDSVKWAAMASGIRNVLYVT
jgi:hypothetical protein